MKVRESLLVGLLAGAAPLPLCAQEMPPPSAEGAAEAQPVEAQPENEEELPEESEEIVVTGQRQPGAAIGDIPAEVQLDARDIRAYGAGSIAELLDALAPQTRSGAGRGGGRPILLLNGRRISGFSEIRDLPPEAIQRVDILPEEVALKYGYRADQRVVNFVLRRRFRALTAEAEAGFPTAGGRSSYKADLNLLRIMRNGRWNVDAEVRRDTALYESERELIQADPARPFALGGNVISPTAGAEIDPALSALTGETLTLAAVPSSTATPGLADFAAGANAANRTDLGRYRTLRPETDHLSLAGTVNRTILGDVSATLNARYEQTLSKSRFGLPASTLLVPSDNPYSPFASDVSLLRYHEGLRPLTRESDNRSAHLGLALNGDILPWRWSLTANYDGSDNDSFSETNPDLSQIQARIISGDANVNPFAPLGRDMIVSGPRDRSRSVTRSADAQLVANGSLLTLPVGDVSTSVRLGADTRSLYSESNRGGTDQVRDLSRRRGSAQVNVDLPIASRRNEVLAAIGNLSANANAEIEHLSDFGTLRTLGAGLNWSPVDQLRLLASVTDEDGAPSIQQLGDPAILVPNVRLFDFTRGQTVDVSRLEGGNPDLAADNRRVFKLSANVKPLEETDLSLTVNYVKSRIDNPIASFPTATPQIEAAFPERFVRDSGGGLVRIDARPVNFERSDRQELRWGINFTKPLAQSAGGGGGGWRARAAQAGSTAAPGRQPSPQAATGTAGAPRPAPAQAGEAGPRRDGAGAGRGGGFRGFGGGGPQGGRLQVSLYHTLHIQNEILIRDGVPVLDLLDGAATGNRGGQPRHEVEAQGGLFRDGMGVRLAANWQSGTRVRGVPDGTGGSTGDLSFSDFATVNLRLFADLGQQRALARRHPWVRGTRVSLSVDNLFEGRIGVRDDSGATPLSYQGAYLDPLGRSVRLSFRKLFF